MNTNGNGIDIKILDILARADQSFENYQIISRLKDVGINIDYRQFNDLIHELKSKGLVECEEIELEDLSWEFWYEITNRGFEVLSEFVDKDDILILCVLNEFGQSDILAIEDKLVEEGMSASSLYIFHLMAHLKRLELLGLINSYWRSGEGGEDILYGLTRKGLSKAIIYELDKRDSRDCK